MLFKFLLLFSLYFPFQLAINPTDGVDLASVRIFILILFFLWLAKGLKEKKLILWNNIQMGLVISFLFLSFFSIFFASNIDWSMRKLGYLFSIFPIYFITSELINSQEKMKKIIQSIVFSGTIMAIFGIFQFSLQFFLGITGAYRLWAKIISPFLGNSFAQMVLAYPSWLVNISGETYFRAIAFFPDPHTLSFFLGLLLPISIGLFFWDKKKVWLIFFGFILLADLLTFSRGGYLGLAGGVIFLFFVFWNKIGKKYKVSLLFGVMTVFLILATNNPISSRFFSTFNFKEGSNLGRIEMWQKASEIIQDKPFFGCGIGNFPLKVDPLANYRQPIYAHNTYLDIASESGILAGLAWLGLLFFTVINFLKKSKKAIIYLSLAVSVVIFSTHSLVDTGIYSPVVLTLLLIILSLASKEDTE